MAADYNNTHGHEFGNDLLKEVANRIQATVRTNDLAARLGGDELALLVRDIADSAISERIAAAIVAAMEQPFEKSGKALIPSVSVGVVTISLGMADLAERSQAIWRADMALYSERQSSRP